MRLTTHGAIIEYDDIGNGTPLLLIHGFPLDRTMWRAQAEGLQSVARVIAPDLRGFGQSGNAPESMTMEDYAADAKALLDALNVKQAVVCGLSMGGYVALAFLAKYRHLVKGLILCNTRSGADSEEAREARYANVKKAYEEGVAAIAEALMPKMLTAATLENRTSLVTFVKAMMARQPVDGVVAALRGMAGRTDRTPMLGGINIPTLIITGSADTLIPPSESEALHKAIPGSRLVTIPDVAHLSNIENADAFNAAVKEFLGRVK